MEKEYCSWEEVDKHIKELEANTSNKLTSTEWEILKLLYEHDGSYDIVSGKRGQKKDNFRQQAHKMFDKLKVLLGASVKQSNFKSELTLFIRNSKVSEEYQTQLPELRKPNSAAKSLQKSSVIASLKLPDGWIEVTQEFLETVLKENQGELQPNDTALFYRCSIPDWIHALSPHKVPLRSFRSQLSQDKKETREEIRKNLEGLLNSPQTKIITITGAIGEGKSTALLQLICDFVNHPPEKFNLQVIWKTSSDSSRSIQNMFEQIFQAQEKLKQQKVFSFPKYIIAIDDASKMLNEIKKGITFLKNKQIKHVHFLLCSSEIDWMKAYQEQNFINANSCWENDGHHEQLTIKFSREDATQLIQAWEKYDNNSDGQGWQSIKSDIVQTICKNKINLYHHLETLTNDDIIKYWFDENKKNLNSLENQDFLGSMLRVRYGSKTKFKQRVERLLDEKFQEIEKINSHLFRSIKKSPQEVYTYIAISHANEIDFLREEIMIKILGISSNEVFVKIIKCFGYEINLKPSGNKIICLTRHQRIAEVFIEALQNRLILSEDKITLYLCELVESAMNAWRDYAVNNFKKRKSFDITPWNKISDLFSENHERAIAITKTQFDIEEKHREKFLIKLVSFYRKKYEKDKNIDNIDEAINLLKMEGENIERLRSFYNEWSLLAREKASVSSNPSIWISIHIYMYAISIADNTPDEPEDLAADFTKSTWRRLNEEDLKKRLISSLKKDAFQDLNKYEPNIQFNKADSAYQTIYNIFKPKSNFHKSETTIKDFNLIKELTKGFAQAYTICESEVPNWVFTPAELSFTEIEKIILQNF